mmetsp:Transcript_4327/g.9313  ORF Transcript_4327/g.9313 Transcript_4327/m.9313 type:complete len:93 (-) Transcript_4327:370-648(-)
MALPIHLNADFHLVHSHDGIQTVTSSSQLLPLDPGQWNAKSKRHHSAREKFLALLRRMLSRTASRERVANRQWTSLLSARGATDRADSNAQL